MLNKIIKSILIVVFVIIPVIVIVNSMFNEFFAYLILVDENTKEQFERYGLLNVERYKAVILEIEPEENNNLILIGNQNEFITEKIDKKHEVNSFIKENGIDIYNVVSIISYVYIIIIAVVIFVKKLLENADMYGKFEERDG